MPLEIKKLPGSEIEISIEVPAEEFETYHQEAFEEIAANFSKDGFRAGKVPREILEKDIPSNDVLLKAAEKAIRKNYFPVLEEHKIEAIGRPEITITKMARGDSFCFKAKTAVLPEIILADYKKIAVEIRKGEELVGEGKEEKSKARQKRRMEILEAIARATEVEIPEILVRLEKEKMLAELRSSIESMEMAWQDYLIQIKKSEDDLRKDWQEESLKRVKYALILRQIVEKENIQVSTEEMGIAVEEISKQAPGLDRDYLRSYTYGIIRNEKVFNFLETC